MTKELFVNGELTLIRTETHGKRKKTKSDAPIFTSRMEKRDYYKSLNYFDIRNVIDVKGLLHDIHTNLHTYVSKVSEWVQNSPVKKLVVTGIFTIMLGIFSNTANAAFIQEYTYQVKNGEKIEEIAAAHGVTAQEILEANGLSSIEDKKILLPKVQNQTVTATKLNIRSQPSTGSSITGQYQKGDVVKVSFIDNGWAAILIEGRVCFLSAEYLTISAPTGDQNSTTTNPQTNTTMYVTASSLRVRQAASTNSAVLGSLKQNDSVSVISIVSGWAKINFNGKVAFVSEAYLTGKEQSNTKTSTTVYVIKAGDTFTKISKVLGVSISSIQELNPTVDPSKLKIGQEIKIPITTSSSNSNQLIVTAHIGGIDPQGTFRFITSDGKTYVAKATGNMINELFHQQGKTITLTLEGNRGQILTLLSLQ
ncbi:SH3 domain-containing protein [Neobacillus rhizosphaerae]|uniref:SH3 domain-containing protein n=1 Tax=Neobacillus rhizosphaerae TaxID=2880965 RepID=UPI003D2CA2E0